MKNYALSWLMLPFWSGMSREKFGYLFRSSKASENLERETQTTSLTPVRFAHLKWGRFWFCLVGWKSLQDNNGHLFPGGHCYLCRSVHRWFMRFSSSDQKVHGQKCTIRFSRFPEHHPGALLLFEAFQLLPQGQQLQLSTHQPLPGSPWRPPDS